MICVLMLMVSDFPVSPQSGILVFIYIDQLLTWHINIEQMFFKGFTLGYIAYTVYVSCLLTFFLN